MFLMLPFGSSNHFHVKQLKEVDSYKNLFIWAQTCCTGEDSGPVMHNSGVITLNTAHSIFLRRWKSYNPL